MSVSTSTRGKYIVVLEKDNHLAQHDGYVYEHRLVAEKMLGRDLKREEVVHHKDGDKYNNSPENLMVFKSMPDHSAYHKGHKAVLDGDVWHCPTRIAIKRCKICGREVSKWNKTCMCEKCSKIRQRRVVRPSKEKLLELILKFPMTKIASMYGVSDNAIRKWCKAYELPYKKKEIKSMSN